MAYCSETAHVRIKRSDLLSVGIPSQLQYTNCINQHARTWEDKSLNKWMTYWFKEMTLEK
ncbi:Hypothetical predicted protein [Olea europaea subsp. europaea]|uniref:Uncharacterized protein n=1 Tax=Olea europaea subsp. europaea TaxID=158383 RepID=A0A8S0VLE4_OLEEU|nr:Hypothetical predicted protein [Olea europaea subsp. europaea]